MTSSCATRCAGTTGDGTKTAMVSDFGLAEILRVDEKQCFQGDVAGVALIAGHLMKCRPDRYSRHCMTVYEIAKFAYKKDVKEGDVPLTVEELLKDRWFKTLPLPHAPIPREVPSVPPPHRHLCATAAAAAPADVRPQRSVSLQVPAARVRPQSPPKEQAKEQSHHEHHPASHDQAAGTARPSPPHRHLSATAAPERKPIFSLRNLGSRVLAGVSGANPPLPPAAPTGSQAAAASHHSHHSPSSDGMSSAAGGVAAAMQHVSLHGSKSEQGAGGEKRPHSTSTEGAAAPVPQEPLYTSTTVKSAALPSVPHSSAISAPDSLASGSSAASSGTGSSGSSRGKRRGGRNRRRNR